MRCVAMGVVLMAIAGCGESTPPFSMVIETRDAGSGIKSLAYKITNTSEKPIEIRKVLYNGEHEAKTCHFTGLEWTANGEGNAVMPAQLTIGQSVYFFIRSEARQQNHEYTKEILFIEVTTDGGIYKAKP